MSNWWRISRLSEPNPEKRLMPTRYPIPGVVAFYVTYTTAAEWLESITCPEDASPHRLTDLEGCTITRVEHYRQRCSVARELIVLHMRSERQDTRFIRLERFKMPREPREDELNGPNHDSVKIVDSIWRAIGNDFHLVQAFAVQQKLDIIDAAGLAFAITHLAQDYSLLHHMSMWWAATYFATARHISNDPVCIRGSGFKNRGKIYTFRLIEDDCRLIQPNGQTIDSMTIRIRKSMQDSKMDPTLVENLIASLDSDIKQEDFRQSPISRAKRAADTASAETRLILKGLVENSVRKRDAAELARRENEELRARTAMVRRENEELRTRATMAEEAAGKAARESVVPKVCYDEAEVARRENEELRAPAEEAAGKAARESVVPRYAMTKLR
ncbi:hypothetical protein BDZ89DRAFT_1156249 [Hymenopellis radicata]|nr:hypothetical protein BDZ89DRAFT_1156249 [Hymenopellis radicata]